MIGKTISHYKITRELGSGGMGVVYEAVDTKLDRTVALKFLPPESTRDPNAKARFIHEAKAASALDHPNVCVIHEIDETDDGQLFLAMARYEGETLKERIDRGPLLLDDAKDITRQVAEGLTEAHERDIVHRDIKPANIFITEDGLVKILDFGLAKLSNQTMITKTGATLGTASYMSPEQASGQKTDHRSDLWCLGVVLYEMITGCLPFPGDHSAAVLYGIINNDPLPITDSRRDVPDNLQMLVAKALRKDRDARYQNVVDLIDDLTKVEVELVEAPGKRQRTAVRGHKKTWSSNRNRLVGVAALILVGSAAALFMTQLGGDATSEPLALAVMEFRNLAEPEDRIQTAGIAGLLHVGFVQNVPARVVSPDYLREVGRRLFGVEEGPVEESQVLQVAKESGADVMLAGQMGWSGESRYVTWRLVDTRTGESLGAMREDGDDLLALADDIVSGVGQVLQISFGEETVGETQSVGELTTMSPEAHQYFAAGMLEAKRYEWRNAAELFQSAVALDSTFALAYFELARAQRGFSYGDAHKSTEKAWGLRAHLSVKDRMRLEAWRLQINYQVVKSIDLYRELVVRWPDDPDLLTSLMSQLYFWWYFTEALEVALVAADLFPENIRFTEVQSGLISSLGRKEEAIAAAMECMDRFPDSINGSLQLAYRYLEAGLPDSADVYFRRVLSVDPKDIGVHRTIAVRLPYCRGDLKGAVENCERFLKRDDLTADGLMGTRLQLAALYEMGGRYDESLAVRDTNIASLTNRVENFYGERGRVASLLRMGNAREALLWSGAYAETLRVHAAEIDDPQYLQFMGIARWTVMDHKASALVLLDSLGVAEVAAEDLLKSSSEFGIYSRRSALFVKLRLALKMKNTDEARVIVEELDEVGGVTSTPWMNVLEELKADMFRLEGRHDEAEKTLKKVLGIYGGRAQVHYQLGQIYEEMNRPEEAANEYERFLEMWSQADEGLPQLTDARKRLALIVGRE